MVFGVPPLIVYAYVGLLRATYSNLKEAWSGFWDNPMSPTFKEWRAFYTMNLLTEFEDERAVVTERVRLWYDMSQVAALQEDVDAIQLRARENYKVGGISLNEFREALGADPHPNGDAIYAVPLPVADQGEGANVEKASVPILGYHIDSGTVSRNEARAQLGLPPEDDTFDQQRRQLQAQLVVLKAALDAQIPIDVALPLVGLDLDIPEPEPAPIVVPPFADDDTDAPAKGRKARDSGSVQSIERRMERALTSYLAGQYRQAAQNVRAG
jgi:hypothetical protein